jgi:hypothetical protein
MALSARTLITTIITGLVFTHSSFASVRSTLNRYTLSTDDTVQMTLEATQPGSVDRPDLTPLRDQFIILGQKNMTISRRIDGVPNTTLRWHVLLRPRYSGQLTIPAFAMGGEQSKPITITVTPGQTSRPTYTPPRVQTENLPEVVIGPNGAPRVEASNPLDFRNSIRMRTSVEPDLAYVGSQLIYTATLTYRTEPTKPLLIAAPTLQRSLVLPLGEESTRSVRLQGEDFIERTQRYVIFPDDVGIHEIDPPMLSAGSIEDADTLTIPAPPAAETIEVLPKAYEDMPWLPSTSVTLTDNSSVPSVITPGTEWVREVTLTAEGVPASELPPLFTQAIEGADTELLSTELTESFDENGLVGHRTETQLIKAQYPGDLSLPTIRVTWWDVNQDKSVTTELSTTHYAVTDTPPVSSPRVEASDALPRTETTEADRRVTDTPDSPSTTTTQNPIIWLLAGLAFLGSAFGVATLMRLRKIQAQHAQEHDISELDRQRAMDLAEIQQHEEHLRRAEAQAFTALMNACHAGNPQAAYDALVSWGELMWPDAHIYNARDVSSAAMNKTLEFAIIDLEQHLYNQRNNDAWMGDLIVNSATTLRERRGFYD